MWFTCFHSDFDFGLIGSITHLVLEEHRGFAVGLRDQVLHEAERELAPHAVELRAQMERFGVV